MQGRNRGPFAGAGTHATRRACLAGIGTALAAGLASPRVARAQAEAIRIGEINSYTAAPAFTLPYRNGWKLGLDQLNAAGGMLGRPVEIISRDDAGSPADAVRHANELVANQKVHFLAGGYLSNVGLAISDYARQHKVLFVASEPLTDALVWEKGHRHCFRLRPSTYMLASMLVEEAAKLPARRWASVAPNYEYGQSAVRWFKQLLLQRRPDVEFVAEQWPALGKIDAAATAGALEAAKPEAILNVTFGADLIAFVRQGSTRGLFEGRTVVSVTTGEPEYLDPLGDEAPVGWIVTGYPVDSVADPANAAFIETYRARFREEPKMGSVVGYAMIAAIAAGVAKSRSVDTEAMADGFGGAAFATPFGPATWRSVDHQSTMGTYVGRTALKNGKGVMVDWRYADGAAFLPPDDAVRALRPG